MLILGHFSPFYPPKNLKNQNFEKCKKFAGDIILHKCTKNHNHMMHGSWDMEWDGYFLLFWAIFCPFTPLKTEKLKFWKKWKWCLGKLSFYRYMCTLNVDHMIYGSRCNRHKFLSFWAILCPFSPLTTQNIKSLKLKKKKNAIRDIIILHICTINDNLLMYGSWYVEQQT